MPEKCLALRKTALAKLPLGHSSYIRVIIKYSFVKPSWHLTCCNGLQQDTSLHPGALGGERRPWDTAPAPQLVKAMPSSVA